MASKGLVVEPPLRPRDLEKTGQAEKKRPGIWVLGLKLDHVIAFARHRPYSRFTFVEMRRPRQSLAGGNSRRELFCYDPWSGRRDLNSTGPLRCDRFTSCRSTNRPIMPYSLAPGNGLGRDVTCLLRVYPARNLVVQPYALRPLLLFQDLACALQTAGSGAGRRPACCLPF